MAFDLDFAIGHIREIFQLERPGKTPDQTKEQQWHKRLLALHINMHMGEIGDTLAPDQEKIVDGFIQQIVRSHPERIFRKCDPPSPSKSPEIISKVSLDPQALFLELTAAITSPAHVSEWLANSEAVQAICEAMAKTATGQQWLRDVAEEWNSFNLSPPFELDEELEEKCKSN